MSKLQKDDYFLLFKTERGRRVLDDLASLAPQLREPTKIKHAIDPVGMGIEIGKADILKAIYKKMKVDPFAEEQKQEFAEKGK